MKVLKIMVNSGAIFHVPLAGFPDAHQVELVEMTPEQYHGIPATGESFKRVVMPMPVNVPPTN